MNTKRLSTRVVLWRQPARVLLTIFLLSMATPLCFAAENSGVSSPTNRMEDAASQELRTYLQLQEQLHATQLAVERNRKEAEDAAVQSAAALNNRLQSLEQTLASTRS